MFHPWHPVIRETPLPAVAGGVIKRKEAGKEERGTMKREG